MKKAINQCWLRNSFALYNVVFLCVTPGFSEGAVLHSCCQGIKDGAGCGSVDDKGNALYSICPDSSQTFFWDGAHPTQAGWAAVTQHYQTILNSLS